MSIAEQLIAVGMKMARNKESEESIEAKAKQIAKAMVETGMTTEQVMIFTGLDRAQVEELSTSPPLAP